MTLVDLHYISWNPETNKFITSDRLNLLNEEGDPITFYGDQNNLSILGICDLMNLKIEDESMRVQVCPCCHKYFLTDDSEKEWFESRGLTAPKRCKICRKNKNRERRTETC